MPEWQGEEIPEQLGIYVFCLEVALKEAGKRLIAAHDRIECAELEAREHLAHIMEMQAMLDEQDRVLRQIQKETGRGV